MFFCSRSGSVGRPTDPDFFCFFFLFQIWIPFFLEKERESFPVCIGIRTHIVETNTNILLLWAFGVGLSRVISGASECKSNLYLRRNQYKRKEKEKTSFFIYGTKTWSKRIWTEYSASPDLELSLAKTKKELRQAPSVASLFLRCNNYCCTSTTISWLENSTYSYVALGTKMSEEALIFALKCHWDPPHPSHACSVSQHSLAHPWTITWMNIMSIIFIRIGALASHPPTWCEGGKNEAHHVLFYFMLRLMIM